MSNFQGSAQAAAKSYIQEELAAGKTRAQIIQQLVAAGWNLAQAQSAVNSAPIPESAIRSIAQGATLSSQSDPFGDSRDADRAKQRRRAVAMMISGALSFLLGLAATVIGYQLAPPGGIYFIFYGAILFGGADFFYGLIKYNNA